MITRARWSSLEMLLDSLSTFSFPLPLTLNSLFCHFFASLPCIISIFSERLVFSSFSSPFLMFPAHCSEQLSSVHGSASNAIQCVFCLPLYKFSFLFFSFLFFFSFLLFNTQFPLDTVFLAYVIALLLRFFTHCNRSTICVYRCVCLCVWLSGEICFDTSNSRSD